MTAHPRPLPTATRQPLTRATLALGSIVIRDDLRVRAASQCEPRHVQDLAATLRRRGALDDLLVWAEEGPDGAPTGRFVLLDGRHRLEAYRAAWRGAEARTRGVPVGVFKGPRMEAQLLALASNARRKLGLSKRERSDAAWRLVWEHGFDLSKSRLARAADVSDGTVGTMRRCWREMLAAGQEPTGDWRTDKGGEPAGAPEMDAERQAAIIAASAALRRLLLRRPRPSTEQLTAVAEGVFGSSDLRWIADFVMGAGHADDLETDDLRGAPQDALFDDF